MKKLIIGVLALALPILVFAPGTRATVLAQAAPVKLSGDLVVYADPLHTWISPDGQWVVFTVTVETPVYHTDVYSTRIDGSTGPNLLFASITDGATSIRIAPDSQHVVVYSANQFLSVPIGGGTPIVLATDSGSGMITDGGASVVYVEGRLTGGYDDYVYRLVRSPIDRAEPTYLTPEVPGIGLWTPAGPGRLFYTRTDVGGARSFWVLPTDSDISLPVTGITNSLAIDRVLADPTGQYIFVVAQTTDYPAVTHYFGVSLSDGIAIEITGLPAGQTLDWYYLTFTPDGQQVVFLTCRPSLAACSTVMRAPAAGGPATLLRAAVGAEGFTAPLAVTAQSTHVIVQTLDVTSLRHRLISLRLSDGQFAELASDADVPGFTLDTYRDLWLSRDGRHVVFDLIRTAGYLEGALYATGPDGGTPVLLEDAEDPIVGGRACITANSQQVVFRDTVPPDTSGGPPDDLGGYLYHMPIWGGAPQPVLPGNPLVRQYFMCPLDGIVLYNAGTSLYSADLGTIATPTPTHTATPSPTATATATPTATVTPVVIERKVFLPTLIH